MTCINFKQLHETNIDVLIGKNGIKKPVCFFREAHLISPSPPPPCPVPRLSDTPSSLPRFPSLAKLRFFLPRATSRDPGFNSVLYLHHTAVPMRVESKTWEPTTRTQSLGKYLYRAPEPMVVAPLILVLSLVLGLMIDPGPVGLTYGFLLIAMPAFLSALVSTPLVEALDGKFYYRRSFLTSFVGVLILGSMLILGLLFRPFIRISWRYLLIYGYSLVLSMRYLVIRSTCLNYNRYSFIISSAQTFFAFVIHVLLSFHDLGYLEQNNMLALEESLFGILSSFCIFISSLLFIETVNAPLETDVGISGTDLLGLFLSYMIEGSKDVETLFTPLQEPFTVPISVLAVRRKENHGEGSISDGPDAPSGNGPPRDTTDPVSVHTPHRDTSDATPGQDHARRRSEIPAETGTGGGERGGSSAIRPGGASKPFHAIIISPSIHPGPVGTIGGGDLPSKLAVPLSGLADHILVPHGAATNDNNPSTSDECGKIVSAVRDIIQSLGEGEFSDMVSPVISRSGDTTMHMIRFGSRGLLISEPRPVPTDDIALEMVTSFAWAARYHGMEEIMVIDAHNNSTRGGSPVHVGDRLSLEMESLLHELLHEEAELDRCSLGFGSSLPDRAVEGLGPRGVETMVLRSHGSTTAFILFDGNNMLPEVRSFMEREALGYGDRALILTADNHVVNATLGGYNPLGQNCSAGELIPPMIRSLEGALRDLHPSEVAIGSGVVEDINLLGFGNTQRLVATINSTIAVVKRAAIPCTLLAFISSALMYLII